MIVDILAVFLVVLYLIAGGLVVGCIRESLRLYKLVKEDWHETPHC